MNKRNQQKLITEYRFTGPEDGRVKGWSIVLRGLQEAVQPLFGLV